MVAQCHASTLAYLVWPTDHAGAAVVGCYIAASFESSSINFEEPASSKGCEMCSRQISRTTVAWLWLLNLSPVDLALVR